jgi:ABC-type antimicrobial peptide transport system permease subunit
MALGAEPGRELRRVLWRALVRLAPGLVLGIGLAYLVTPIFGVFLSGMDPRDPRIFASIALGYIGVALAAAAIPARRAAALDPTQVLRND